MTSQGPTSRPRRTWLRIVLGVGLVAVLAAGIATYLQHARQKADQELRSRLVLKDWDVLNERGDHSGYGFFLYDNGEFVDTIGQATRMGGWGGTAELGAGGITSKSIRSVLAAGRYEVVSLGDTELTLRHESGKEVRCRLSAWMQQPKAYTIPHPRLGSRAK